MKYDFKYKNEENVITLCENAGVPFLQFRSLEECGVVTHGFSTRMGGVSEDIYASMNLSYTRGDKEEAVTENFIRIAKALEVCPEDYVFSDQTHTTNIRVVTEEDRGKGFTKPRDYENIDGLVTNVKGLVLSTFYADCVPLYFVDVKNKAIGLSHSGWKGTVGRMGKQTILAMQEAFGTKPQDLVCAIGPSICQDCYEVSEDVAFAFRDNFDNDDKKAYEYLKRYQEEITQKDIANCLVYKKENNKYQLNLWYSNYRVFRDAGVPDSQISVTDICTCCNPKLLFSHRASKGMRGNLGAFMMIEHK